MHRTPTAYTPADLPRPSSEELRATIPGWGVDLDPRDRPSVPRERTDLETGAHWDLPEDQPHDGPRERSIEHLRLPPVFGTAQPLRGVSGAIRGYAYARFSEGRAAHWLLLLGAVRVEAYGSQLGSFASRRPVPPWGTGLRAELTHHGLRSRRGRVDARHHLLDPLVVLAPYLATGLAVRTVWRRVAGRA